MNIPLCIPEIGEDDILAVTGVLSSRWLAHGQKNKEFEEHFAEYIGVKHAVTLNSCTSALFLACQELKGEIILPSFTFPASANAVVAAGAKPVFVDIDPKTLCINPDAVRKAISPKTTAIMPVHYAGQSANMGQIMETAEEHNLKVIEDSAECIGGTWKGKKTGSFGIGCFSFFPTKNITTGEGGMITTNDKEFAEKIAAMSAHGMHSKTIDREKMDKPWIRSSLYPGHNMRMSNMLAALGDSQLKKVDQFNGKRRQHAAYLNRQLENIPGLKVPFEHEHARHTYQMYVIQVEKGRDRIVNELRKRGVMASVHFDPPAHTQPAYKAYERLRLPVTESASKACITLPMFPGLQQEQLDFMVNAVKEVIQ
ncbi:MAG TPA: DegT/DnrJ/EryC1/StrS family aminotransferase [Candidatus Nanoarchaeia archaeon]|nr:DegT/DnrJ/EryC1/StrS family aminotransferase [Candidatus Nanoarchaeia archaeon]